MNPELISAAAEAIETFAEDELELYAMTKRQTPQGEDVWIETSEGVDGRRYFVVKVHRPGSPFVCTQGEHLSFEAAVADLSENWT